MYLTTIRETDVGESMLRRGGTSIYIADVIGPVQPCDVGKRVYSANGIIQVENDEQREKRHENHP